MLNFITPLYSTPPYDPLPHDYPVLCACTKFCCILAHSLGLVQRSVYFCAERMMSIYLLVVVLFIAWQEAAILGTESRAELVVVHLQFKDCSIVASVAGRNPVTVPRIIHLHHAQNITSPSPSLSTCCTKTSICSSDRGAVRPCATTTVRPCLPCVCCSTLVPRQARPVQT